MIANLRRSTCALLAGVAVGFGSPAAAASPDTIDADDEFRSAVGAYRDGRLAEAIERIRRVLDARPTDADAVWNLGLWTAEANRPEEALQAWTRYRELAPDDWRGRAKRIQAFQALGRSEQRDREIAALIERRAGGSDPALVALQSFCRDQFAAGEERVLALQHFDPSGPRPVVVEFVVLAASGDERGRYRLASWDEHNDTVWDESEITRPYRTYELSWRSRAGRETVTWYEGRPDYEKVRRDVARDLAARSGRPR